MSSVAAQITSVCANISANIDLLGDGRALLAQNLLSQLRNLVAAVAVRLHHKDGARDFHYNDTGPAIDWIGSVNKINFLYRFQTAPAGQAPVGEFIRRARSC